MDDPVISFATSEHKKYTNAAMSFPWMKDKLGCFSFNSFFSSNRMQGLSMLIHQAAPCFEEWFGIEPEIDSGLFSYLYKNGEI